MEANKIRTESMSKGMLAGLIGGLAGTAAKRIADKIFMPGIKGEILPPLMPGEGVREEVEGPSGERRKPAVMEANQWALGALTGAAYGVVVERNPGRAAWRGAAFGLGLDRLAREGALPAMVRTAPRDAQTPEVRFSKKATYVVYGVATELVRRVVRSKL